MAHLTNFSFEFFYKIFTEDASLCILYQSAKKSKMTKNSNQGGPAFKGKENCENERGETASFKYNFVQKTNATVQL